MDIPNVIIRHLGTKKNNNYKKYHFYMNYDIITKETCKKIKYIYK